MSNEEIYKGKKITVSNNELEITIDDKKIIIDFDEDDNTYSLYSVLPYATFTTSLDLAKAVIDMEIGGN